MAACKLRHCGGSTWCTVCQRGWDYGDHHEFVDDCPGAPAPKRKRATRSEMVVRWDSLLNTLRAIPRAK